MASNNLITKKPTKAARFKARPGSIAEQRFNNFTPRQLNQAKLSTRKTFKSVDIKINKTRVIDAKGPKSSSLQTVKFISNGTPQGEKSLFDAASFFQTKITNIRSGRNSSTPVNRKIERRRRSKLT